MLTRRCASFGLLTTPVILAWPKAALSQENQGEQESLDQLDYPQFELLDAPSLFGNRPATAAQIAEARLIVNNTPTGPSPIDVAQSFVDRFAASDPEAIAQWPRPSNWNPLVVNFFGATSTKANNDMIAWCAAFANWCLERAGRSGSRSASSQSFLASRFRKTATPKRGDLALWTCYDVRQRSLGLGHVAFYNGPRDDRHIDVIGGNQSKDNHSSIISEVKFPIYDRMVTRGVNGRRVPCIMKFNTYVSVQ